MGKQSREKKERRWQTDETSIAVSSRTSNLERIYFLIIEWGTYLILFTPLIVNKHFFFPYVAPKTIFFRILVDIIFIAYLFLIVANPRYRPKLNALSWSIIVFLGVSFIASVFGVNFIRSFWSTFERMTGLVTFIHLFVFFLVLTSVFKERKYWERILTVSILVGVTLSFYVFNSVDASARGGGTLGNTSFMSAYMLFNIFFAIILFFTKKGWWKIFYGLILIPVVWLLLFPPREPTQGAIGAFAGGLFLLALGFLIFHLLSFKRKSFNRLVFGLIVFLIFGTVGFTQTNLFKDKLSAIAESNSWQARERVWGMAFKGWQEKPWLGWGLENFNVAFAKNFDPSLPPTGDVWYDRVHNIVLDTSIDSGIIGFLSYLAIFGVAIFGLLRVSMKVVERKNVFLPLGMAILLMVYFAQNLWVFDMVSSYMVFFLSLSFIYFLIEGGKEKEEIKKANNKRPYFFIIALLIILTLFTVYFGNIKPAQSSKYLVKGLSSPFDESIVNFQKAIYTSPIGRIEGAEQFSRKMSDFSFQSGIDKEVLKKGFGLAEEEMKKAIEQNPLDFRFYLVLGKQYNNLFHFSGDTQALALAEETLEEAKKLSPKNQQVYWELAQNSLYQGKKMKRLFFCNNQLI